MFWIDRIGGRLLSAIAVGVLVSVVWSFRRYQAREPMRDVLRRATLVMSALLVAMAALTVLFPLALGWEGLNPVEEFRGWLASDCGPAYRYNRAQDEGCYDTGSANLWDASGLATVGVALAIAGIGLLREPAVE